MDPETLKLVEYVLRTPTGELDPETVSPFMEVDPSGVPEKLRGGVLAKKEEIEALAKIAAGRGKAPLRRIGNDEAPVCETTEADEARIYHLKLAGYETLEEREVLKLMEKTSCTECELQTEFTLRVFIKKPAAKKAQKPGRPEHVYLLHTKDPLMALVSAMRSGQEGGGTNFFGVGMYPKCR